MGNNYSKLQRTYFLNDFTHLELKGLEDLKYARQKDLHKSKLQKVMFSSAMDFLINTSTPEDIPYATQLVSKLEIILERIFKFVS